MANAFYIYIEAEKQGKIDGDVEQEGREASIRGYRFSSMTKIPRHESTGQPTGNRTHYPVIFTKHADKSTPLLWQAMTTGERLTSVKFDFYRINQQGENENFYSVTLYDAMIVEMETDLADTSTTVDTMADEIREHLHLTFRRIEWEMHVDGTAAANDWLTS